MAKNLQLVLQELEQMNHLSRISKDICFQEITSLKKKLQETLHQQELSSIKQKLLSKLELNRNKFQSLSRIKIKPNQKASELLKELYFIVSLGIYVCFDKKIPRQTQFLCFWLNTRCQRLIQEVKTGEGKTMIVAMTALFYALIGKKVDVFTSSATLATTETRPGCEVYELFKLFGITLSSNCQEKKMINPTNVYNCQVIYGTSFQFEADYLKYRFGGDSRYFIDRNFDQNHIAILDEVDALLIDRMTDTTRLSEQKPLYQIIRIVFILINQVRQKLRAAKLQFSGIMKVTILDEPINLDDLKFNQLQDELQKLKNKKEYINVQEQLIHKIVKKGLTQTGLKHIIPQYLIENNGYISYMLPIWTKSLSQSIYFKKDIHYYLENEKVIPIDISTGNFQNSTKWENGIHQFVEIRQKISPSVDGVVSNYQSNYIYFTRYRSNFYGMTGTITPSIGKTLQQIKNQMSIFEEFLKEAYKVEILKIPTAKKRLLTQKTPIFSITNEGWYQSILKQTLKQSKNRMVLVIFQNISEAKHFLKMLREKKPQNLIHQMYNSNEYHENLQKINDVAGTVIVATNLGGRGTDIKIQNTTIINNGGLHVIMTYFADNTRIQQQAFGRAGRNGQPGSGRFNISLHDKFKILDNQNHQQFQNKINQQNKAKEILQELKANRTSIEESNFQLGKKTIKFERQKRNILDKFYQQYTGPLNKAISKFKSDHQNNPSQRIHLINYYQKSFDKCNVQEQWGLFLKKNLNLVQQKKQLNVTINDFKICYKQAYYRNQMNPGYYSYFGSLLMDVKQTKAEQYFNKYVQQDDWINQYYKVYFYLKENQGQFNESKAKEISKKLLDLSASMIVAYTLKLAIIPANSQKHQQTSEKIAKFFIGEIGHFKAVTQILQQCAKMKKKRFQYKVTIQKKRNNIIQMQIRGMLHHMSLQIVQIIQQQQPSSDGLFTTLWKGIVSLVKACVKTVISAAATVVAVVATPVLQIFGKPQTSYQMWKQVGKAWKDTGNQWMNVLKNIKPLATLAFSCLALAVSGGYAIPAFLSFILWLLDKKEPGTTQRLQKLQLNNKSVDKKSFVQITGDINLDQKIQQKLKQKRQQLQTEQIKVKKQFKDLQEKLLKEYLNNKLVKQQIDQILFIGTPVKQVSHTNFIRNKTQIQMAEKIQQYPIKQEYVVELQSNITNLQSKIQTLVQQNNNKITALFNSAGNNIKQNLAQVIQKQLVLAQKNNLTQEQFNVIQKQKNMQAQKELKILQHHTNYIIQSQVKIPNYKPELSEIKLCNQDHIKQILQTISSHKNQIIAAQQDYADDVKIVTKFVQNIVSVDDANVIKDQLIKKTIKEGQDKIIKVYSKKLKKKELNELNKLRNQSSQIIQKQLQKIEAQQLKQIKIKATSIFQKPSNINQLFHYAKIAEYYAKINKLTFKKADDHLQAVEAVKQLYESFLIISNDGFIIKNDQNKILAKSWIINAQIKEIFLSIKNCDIQYCSQELPKQKGVEIISKLFNYFKKNNNETKLSWDKISDLYIKSVIYQQIQALLKGKFAQIYERRLLKKINLNYLPFEIEENEEQFEQFKNNLMDIIIKKHLIQSEIILKYRYKIKSVLQNLQTQQYKQWIKMSQK